MAGFLLPTSDQAIMDNESLREELCSDPELPFSIIITFAEDTPLEERKELRTFIQTTADEINQLGQIPVGVNQLTITRRERKRPIWATEKKPVDKQKTKKIIASFVILAAAVLSGSYVQFGIDHTTKPSILGFLAFCLVTASVAYSLEKVVRKLYFPA